MWYVCVEYYSAIKKNEILPFSTMWMELEDIILSEIVRERQTSCDFTHMWNLRAKTDEHRGREGKIRWKQRETNHKRLLTLGNKLRVDGGEVGRGME